MTAALARGAEAALGRAVNERLARACAVAAPRVLTRVQAMVREAVAGAPEALSLEVGALRGELGVEDGGAAVDAVAEAVALGAAASASGPTMSVAVLRSDLAEALALAEGSFESEGGHRVEWLRWLLTAGDEVVNPDYGFVAGAFPASRTGLGVMKRGGSWAVPGEFAGSPDDNWLTRAVSDVAVLLPPVAAEEVGRAV